MSQHPQHPQPPQERPQVVYQQAPSNGLGVAGFVVSLVGFLVCGGLVCPIGVIMSAVALGREPKGFAIAGLIIGLLGSAWLVIFFIFFGFAALAGAAGP